MASSSKNNHQSEPAKTEQIITEFFAKSLHIILESRSPCASSRNFSGEQHSLSSPSSSSSSSSSVRPRDKWFNLALRECPAALENLDFWRQSNLEPMVVDVVLVKKPIGFGPGSSPGGNFPLEEHFPSSWNSRHEGYVSDMKNEKVIERWIVRYESRNIKCKESNKVNKRGGGNSSQSLYKKSIILLRSLYTTVRILPGYKLYRDLNSSGQIRTYSLAHRVSSFVEPFTYREEAEMHRFAFTPLETSCGRLCLSVLYRPTLSDVNSGPSTPISPQFIPDYVGSPTTNPLKRFPSLPLTDLESQGSPSSVPFARRHSWSYDAFRNFNPSISSLPSPTYSDSRTSSSKMNSQLVGIPPLSPENPYSNISLSHKHTSFDEYWPSPMFSPSPSPSPPTLFSGNTVSNALLRSESAPVAIPTSKLGKNPTVASNDVLLPPSPSPRNTKPNSFSQADNVRALMRQGDMRAGISTQKISSFGKDEFGNPFGAKLSSHSSPRKSFSRSSDRFLFQDEFDDSEFCPFAFDDVDTTDLRIRPESLNGKEHLSQLLDPAGLLPVRKSQGAAVGSLVQMLNAARPLHQDFSNSKVMQTSRPEILDKSNQEPDGNSTSETGVYENPASNYAITSSGLLMLKTTSEALEELRGYKDMKDELLKKENEHQNLKDVSHAAGTEDKGKGSM